MSSDGGGGVFPVRIIASRPPCLGLRAQVELGGASYTEVRPRATVVQHHDRKQPSQPTSPTCARPVTNGVAIKQRSQLRAENVDTVGATGESQSHLRTLAGPVPLSDGREGGEGGVVGFGEGVEVFLGGDDAAVAESFFDGLEAGAAGEEPGGVAVAEVVGADADADSGGVEGGFPDLFAEPGAGMCPSVVMVRGVRGWSFPAARRSARYVA
jgi:hypothetical protein